MKKIIVMLGMVCMFGGVANAASSSMIGVLESSITVRVVAISSTTATDVCTGIEMPDRTILVLRNSDSSVNLNCSDSAAGLTAGQVFTIEAGGGTISLAIRPYSAKNAAPLKIFCKSIGSAATTNLTVIQAY